MDAVYEINYSNFQPSEDIKKLLYSNVDNILRKAPSDAFLSVNVALHQKIYKINFKLCSKVSTIQKNVANANLLLSINELQESVVTALQDWSRSRNFNHEALR